MTIKVNNQIQITDIKNLNREGLCPQLEMLSIPV